MSVLFLFYENFIIIITIYIFFIPLQSFVIALIICK